MSHEHVCPWLIGYFLASPIRRLFQKPEPILAPFVKTGMRILEIGPGMGFFTLPMARMAGPTGKIFAIDIQERMLSELRNRAAGAGLADRIECRLTQPDKLGVEDLRGSIDFTLLIAVMHEVPDAKHLFAEIHGAMKPGGKVLLADPISRCPRETFDNALAIALEAGFVNDQGPAVRRSWSAVLVKDSKVC